MIPQTSIIISINDTPECVCTESGQGVEGEGEEREQQSVRAAEQGSCTVATSEAKLCVRDSRLRGKIISPAGILFILSNMELCRVFIEYLCIYK